MKLYKIKILIKKFLEFPWKISKDFNTFLNIYDSKFIYWGGYTNYWTFHQDLNKLLHIKGGSISGIFEGYSRRFLIFPYRWFKVDVVAAMNSFNKHNYLWIHKNPANIESMQEMAFLYLKPNSIVHKKLVWNSEIIAQQRAKEGKKFYKFLQKKILE